MTEAFDENRINGRRKDSPGRRESDRDRQAEGVHLQFQVAIKNITPGGSVTITAQIVEDGLEKPDEDSE